VALFIRPNLNMKAVLLRLLLGAIVAARGQAVTLLTPANSSSSWYPFPHFTWDCSTDPTSEYDIQLATHPSFANLLAQDTINGVACRYFSMQSLQPNRYYWRVRYNNQVTLTAQFTITPVDHTVTINASTDWSEIRASLSAAYSLPGSKRIVFASAPANEYRLLPPSSLLTFLNLSNVDDVFLDGNHQRFNFSLPTAFSLATDCNRIVLANFTFDIHPLPYTALRVRSLTSAAAIVTTEPGHPLPDSLAAFLSNGIAELMTAATRRVKRGGPLILGYTNVSRLAGCPSPALGSNNTVLDGICFQLTLTGNSKAVTVDDIIVIDPRLATGIEINGGSSAALVDNVLYACSNECLTSQNHEQLAILNTSLLRLPERYLAANNGGHNHHSMAIAPWIAGSTFMNTGDDICHVSGLVMSVFDTLNSTTARLQRSLPDVYAGNHDGELHLAEGDILSFFNLAAGHVLQQNRIVGITGPVRVGDKDLTTVMFADTLDSSVVPGFIGSPVNTSVRSAY
jgi:hypothetical protein